MIRSPRRRKENQQVMNHWQSTSISGKLLSENLAGEGGSRISTTRMGEGCSAPLHPNVPDRTPALPSPARGQGTFMSAELPDIVAGEGHGPPRPTTIATRSPPLARFLKATEIDTRMLGMIGALAAHLDRLPRSLAAACS